MPDDKTSIQVRNETWKRLTLRKELSDTFDDVITDLLDKIKHVEEVD